MRTKTLKLNFFFSLLFFAISPLLFCQQKLLIKDFQVNENAGWCENLDARITVHDNGSFTIVWSSYENTNGDIFLQRFDNRSMRIGNSILVNDDAGSGRQISPDIALDSAGNSVIAWLDERSGKSEIYAQRFDYSANPIGHNFLVTSTKSTLNENSIPSAAMSLEGTFIIVWQEFNNKYNIWANLYDHNGVQIGQSIKVSDSVSSISQYAKPKTAMNGSGNFVIVWEDLRKNSHGDIYAQRFDFQGNRIGNNFKVNDDVNNRYHGDPSISAFADGGFVITWIDERKYNYDIFAQRYDKSGNPVSNNFIVNDVEAGQHFTPVVSASSSGRFAITWKDQRESIAARTSSRFDIFSQIYDQQGAASGSNFKIQDDDSSMYYLTPSASGMDAAGNFIVVWNDNHTGLNQIYAKRLDKTGLIIDPVFQVNNNEGSSDQLNPVICASDNGSFAVIWEDFRNGNADIYLQGFAGSGTPIGNNQIVNDNTNKSKQSSPQAGIDSLGNILVVWMDKRDGKENIYGQRFNSLFNPVGTNFRINDNRSDRKAWYPKIAMNNNGNCIVAWVESSMSGSLTDLNIYAQRFDENCSRSGSNFKVNDNEGTIVGLDFSSEDIFSAGISDKNQYVISWTAYQNSIPGITFKLYNSDGLPIGTARRIDYDGSVTIFDQSMCRGSGGNFVTSWVNWKSAGKDNLYAQLCNQSGDMVKSNLAVNDVPGSIYRHLPPSLSMNGDGGFCIAWQDSRNDSFDIYAQIYSAVGRLLDKNFRINSDNGISDQRNPAIFLRDKKLYSAWEDNSHAGQGWNIFANVISPGSLDSANDSNTDVNPDHYNLYQNYPNPFNPHTMITYSIPEGQHVKITIYDMLGKEVAVLADKYMPAGTHSVQFVADNLPSGIYVYTMQTGQFRDSKKLMILR